MADSTIKNAPIFGPEVSYETWKMSSFNSIEMNKADMRNRGHIQRVLWVAVVSQLSRDILCYTEYVNWHHSSARESGFNSGSSGEKGQSMNTQKRTNPLDRYGNRTKCTICGSVFHWVKKFKICPPPFRNGRTLNQKPSNRKSFRWLKTMTRTSKGRMKLKVTNSLDRLLQRSYKNSWWMQGWEIRRKWKCWDKWLTTVKPVHCKRRHL